MINRGGIERAASVLVNGLVERGHHVDMLTLEHESVPIAFPIDPRIRVRQLDLNRPSRNKFGALAVIAESVWTIRQTIKQLAPDVVISFQGQLSVMTVVACKGLGVPVIGAERTHPGEYYIGRGWEQVRKLVYPWLASLVLQTNRGAKWAAREFGASVTTIANPVLSSVDVDHTAGSRKTVIGAGALTPGKGFDKLIVAFERLSKELPEWDLVIYGEGLMRTQLESMVAQMGLDSRVHLPGNVEDLGQRLVEGNLFVLSSLAEGFPNVLGEAMARGLPAVAFDCPSGPADIVRHGKDGLLVPLGDIEKLAEAMGTLMGDDKLRARFASKAGDVVERFSLNTILDKWEALMREVSR